MKDKFKRSREMFAESSLYLAGGASTSARRAMRPFPLFIEKGEGAYMYDVDNNKYVDYILGWGPLVLGHSHPHIVETVGHYLKKGQTFGVQHPLEIDVARRLTNLIPCADLVCFSNTGTEAVLSALRIARAFTGKRYVVKFHGHYHGWSDTMYLGTNPVQAGAVSSWKPMIEAPGTAPGALEDTLLAPWNDIESLEKLLDQHGDQVAAVIMEPFACNTGVVFPAPGYLQNVRELTEKRQILLIFDEVITGFRVGLHSAQGRLGIMPDMTVMGKAVAGGFPLSLIGGRKDVMNLVAEGKVPHYGTFNGNPIVTAAAFAALDILSNDNGSAYDLLESLGIRLADGLRSAAKEAEIPVVVHQVGSIVFMHMSADPIIRYDDVIKSDKASYLQFTEYLTLNGILPTSRGLWYLSVMHTESDIDRTIAVAREALNTFRNNS